MRLPGVRESLDLGELQALVAAGRHAFGHLDQVRPIRRVTTTSHSGAGRHPSTRSPRGTAGAVAVAGAAATRAAARGGPAQAPRPTRARRTSPTWLTSIGWNPSASAGDVGLQPEIVAPPHRRTADRPSASPRSRPVACHSAKRHAGKRRLPARRVPVEVAAELGLALQRAEVVGGRLARGWTSTMLRSNV